MAASGNHSLRGSSTLRSPEGTGWAEPCRNLSLYTWGFCRHDFTDESLFGTDSTCMGYCGGGWEKYGEMGSLFIYLVNFAEITECPTIMALATLLSLIKTRAGIHIAFVLCKAQFLIRLSYFITILPRWSKWDPEVSGGSRSKAMIQTPAVRH